MFSFISGHLYGNPGILAARPSSGARRLQGIFKQIQFLLMPSRSFHVPPLAFASSRHYSERHTHFLKRENQGILVISNHPDFKNRIDDEPPMRNFGEIKDSCGW